MGFVSSYCPEEDFDYAMDCGFARQGKRAKRFSKDAFVKAATTKMTRGRLEIRVSETAEGKYSWSVLRGGEVLDAGVTRRQKDAYDAAFRAQREVA